MTETSAEDSEKIRQLYRELLDGWNNRDAEAMAATFTEDGESIGYDGSEMVGKREIVAHLQPIFDNHETPAYVSKVKDVRFLAPETAMLRAIAGLVPPGKSAIESSVNAHQTVIAVKREGEWRIVLYQNTAAQYHGRPELVEAMTRELQEVFSGISD